MRHERNAIARAAEAQRFLERHPSSVLRATVRAEIDAIDQKFFRASRYDERGLEVYVRTFPRGRNVQLAKRTLDAFRTQRAAVEAAHAGEAREAEDRRHVAVQRARGFVRETVRFFLESARALRGWGRQLSTLESTDAGFFAIWSGPPEPVCGDGAGGPMCRKRYERSYFVPIPGGTRRDDRATLSIQLGTEGSGLRTMAIDLGSGGFRRWQEMETARPADQATPEAEAAVIGWGVASLQELVRATFPSGVDLAPEGPTVRWSYATDRLRIDVFADDASTPSGVVVEGLVIRQLALPQQPPAVSPLR